MPVDRRFGCLARSFICNEEGADDEDDPGASAEQPRHEVDAGTALMACAALCLMEERPLAGPSTPVEMAE